MTVGVIVSTNTRPGASVTPRRAESRTFITVQAEKGRVGVPVLIRNPQEYANEFGEWVSYGFGTDFITTHFALGGSEVYVARVVGPAATKGTLTLQNRVGSPQPAIRIDAIGEGPWSQYVTVKVEDGTLLNSVTVTVSYKAGVTGLPDEVYRNVGLASDGTTVSGQSIIDAINARSNLVTATNLNPATTTGATARLAVLTATALSTGTDDATNATAAVMTAMLTTAFPKTLGPGMVAVPGYLHSTISAAVGGHAAAMGREGVLAGTYGESTASIGSAAGTIQGAVNGKALMLAYPWIQVPTGNGSSKWIEPTGYFTGVRARTSERIGVWQEAANKFGADEAGYVLALATSVDEATNSDLEARGVSVLRKTAGRVRPMGWRNLGTDSFDSMADTDELNAVAYACKALLDDELFSGIDDNHVSLHKAVELCKGVVAARANAGAYHSGDGDPGYSADGVEDIPNSAIRVRVGFRRRRSAKTIYLDVTASAFNAPV